MRALVASLRTDIALQSRYRLYNVGIAVALILGAVMWLSFEPSQSGPVLAGLYLSAVGGTTYLFVAAAIIFEREQRTLSALAVTPIRPHDYLLSKLISLCGFATVECLIVFAAARGQRLPSPGWMLVGVLSFAVFLTLIGVTQALKARSFTQFLVPTASVVVLVLQLPVLELFGLWRSPWLYVIPSRPAAVFMRAAYEPVAGVELIYATLYSVVLLAGAGWLALSRVRRELTEAPRPQLTGGGGRRAEAAAGDNRGGRP